MKRKRKYTRRTKVTKGVKNLIATNPQEFVGNLTINEGWQVFNILQALYGTGSSNTATMPKRRGRPRVENTLPA